MDFHLWQIISLVGIGLVAGTLGGMLGVGGSIIMIPGMILVFGPGQHLYQAAAMIVNVFVAAPSALRHIANRVVLPPVVKWLVPAAVAGVMLGVAASNLTVFSGERTANLTRLFAGFLVYVAVYNLYRLLIARRRLPSMDNSQAGRIHPLATTSVGLGMGLVAGLLGVGGGILAVPAQQVFLRIPLKNAIGNSACTMVFSAIFGAIYKNVTLGRHGEDLLMSLLLAAALIPSGFIGGNIGAQLTHRLPLAPVRIVFVLLMAAAAWKMWTGH